MRFLHSAIRTSAIQASLIAFGLSALRYAQNDSEGLRLRVGARNDGCINA